jgi:hypothetical protein
VGIGRFLESTNINQVSVSRASHPPLARRGPPADSARRARHADRRQQDGEGGDGEAAGRDTAVTITCLEDTGGVGTRGTSRWSVEARAAAIRHPTRAIVSRVGRIVRAMTRATRATLDGNSIVSAAGSEDARTRISGSK